MLNAEGADQSGLTDCTAGSARDNQIVMAASLSGSVIDLTGGGLPTLTRKVEFPVAPLKAIRRAWRSMRVGAPRIFEIEPGQCRHAWPI